MNSPIITLAPDPPSARLLSNMEAENTRMEAVLALTKRNAELKAKLSAEGITMSTRMLTWREIMDDFAQERGLEVKDLIGIETGRWIARPRHELMWILYEQRNRYGGRRWSSPNIGVFLGGRDHTTVLEGIRKHKARMAEAAG